MVAIKSDFGPRTDRDSSLFQLVGVNPVMYFVRDNIVFVWSFIAPSMMMLLDLPHSLQTFWWNLVCVV